MARARNIKPSIFKNEILGEADPLLTILFQGLWCLADREGRLEDRPKRIKAEIFPYRELPDFNGYLTELERLGFIDRYQVGETAIIQVLNFKKHQSPHKTEKESELPEKPKESDSCPLTDKEPLDNESPTVKESLIPDSLIPDSRKMIPEKKRRFTPPTLDDIKNYIVEKDLFTVDAESFLNFYASKDWMVGKNKMKDWRAALTGWHTRNGGSSAQRPAPRETVIQKHSGREWAQ